LAYLLSYGLLNDDLYNSHHTAPNYRDIREERIGMDKEGSDCGVIEVLHVYLPGETKKMDENNQESCLRPRFEHGTTQKRSKVAKH
jgi:hypothetical protein